MNAIVINIINFKFYKPDPREFRLYPGGTCSSFPGRRAGRSWDVCTCGNNREPSPVRWKCGRWTPIRSSSSSSPGSVIWIFRTVQSPSRSSSVCGTRSPNWIESSPKSGESSRSPGKAPFRIRSRPGRNIYVYNKSLQSRCRSKGRKDLCLLPVETIKVRSSSCLSSGTPFRSINGPTNTRGKDEQSPCRCSLLGLTRPKWRTSGHTQSSCWSRSGPGFWPSKNSF